MKALSPLCHAVLAAAAILGLSALIVWASPAFIDPEWSRRLGGALLGVVVVVYANAVPKAAEKHLRCSPAAAQAARRLAGWSLVLGGLAYVLAWLLAPLDMAAMIGGLALGTAVTCAALGCIRIGARRAGQ